ncbi:DUF2190 family protein [bacterium]|nr:DUF2190 family protein [bacterium]
MRTLMVCVLLLIATGAGAFETQRVEMREGAENDGRVAIYRDGGELMFSDNITSDPVSLTDLVSRANEHGELTGLVEDDHLQYLNDARHGVAHDAAFNDAMPVLGDVTGGVTIGQHIASADYHLGRTEEETISAPWYFNDVVHFDAGTIRLSTPNPIGEKTVIFEEMPFSASLTYDPMDFRFELNRALWTPWTTSESGVFTEAAVSSLLSGRFDGNRSAVLEGFVSVEGIAAGDLVSREVAEDILGDWEFLSPLGVAATDDSEDLRAEGVAISFATETDGAVALDNRERAALRADLTATLSSDGGMANALAAGVYGDASIDQATAASTSGLVSGVYGIGRSARNSLLAAGVTGVVDESETGTRRIGVLGALSKDDATSVTMIPPGDHAGVFLGDVFVGGATTIVSTNASGGSIAAGDVVAWTAGGVAIAPAYSSATGAVAGVATNDTAAGETVVVAFGGVAHVKVSSSTTAGQGLAWNGSYAVAASAGCRAPIGTATESGSGTVAMQVIPAFNP